MDSLQKRGKCPEEILAKLRASRSKRGKIGPSKTAVYRFLAGETYKHGRAETRGRKARSPHGLLAIANTQRRRLIKQARNEMLVTWPDVHAATKRALRVRGGLGRGRKMPSVDWLSHKLRDAYQIRARPGKRRISRTTVHERRKGMSKRWRGVRTLSHSGSRTSTRTLTTRSLSWQGHWRTRRSCEPHECTTIWMGIPKGSNAKP